MAHIFISYSSADHHFIDQLIPLIRRVTVVERSVWFNDEMSGGVDWWEMILNEIAACDIFVYLISNKSLESPYCQAELREALRLRKQILPVIVRRLKPPYPGRIDADLASVLRQMQYVDMSGGFNYETNSALYAALARVVNTAPQQPAAPVTPTPTPEPRVPDKAKRTSKKRTTYIIRGFVLAAIVIISFVWLGQRYFGNPPLTNADWQTLHPDGSQHTFEDGVTMVLVPAGCFMMGSDDIFREAPVHEQCFDQPFWIDKYEVTQADFERLGGEAEIGSYFKGDHRPVEFITWFEARDFCALRGARLPTEPEWEYAARGPDALVYPWGDFWDEYNAVWNWNRSRSPETADVGSLPRGRSWVGAMDMSGNVSEWTSSLLLFYDSPEDPEAESVTEVGEDSWRVVRGGSAIDDRSFYLRSAYRSKMPNDSPHTYRGFRCARDSE